MKSALMILLCLVAGISTVDALAQISQFQHIIVVVQENRTPDNLFYVLCAISPCSTTPDNTQYNVQTADWLDETSPTGVTQPIAIPLANRYGVDHSHAGWKNQCDLNLVLNPPQCRMDGAAHTSKNRGSFGYVTNTQSAKYPNGNLSPYLAMATQYGWANFMFQTNQGPSFPAHQIIFGGTSAIDASDDAAGIFVSENVYGNAGCYAQDGDWFHSITADGKQTTVKVDYAAGVTECWTRITMADVLNAAGVSWKYYSVKGGGEDHGSSIWTAPNTSQMICVPDANHQNCTGSEWSENVDLNPADVLRDMGMKGKPCNLRGVSWVIPTGDNSDHGGANGGPDWVGSIVNALGNSACTNPDGTSYWNTTAVVVTWDDWGGFYDHVPPPLLPYPQGGYQMGFRVPLVFVSAYTPVGYIDNLNYDFGSILRFIENNFTLGEGILGFADSRATTDFSTFYDPGSVPRQFGQITTVKSGLDFITDQTPPTDPDED